MLASRRKAPIHTHSVWIHLNMPSLRADASATDQAHARAFVVTEVIKFLIVNRGLASNTVDQLHKAVQAYRAQQASRNSRSRGAPAIRRAEQFVAGLGHVSSSLVGQLLARSTALGPLVNPAVAVALGPSPGRARELYTVRFADGASQLASEQPLADRSHLQATNQKEEAASRQLIKCLLQEYSALPPWQDTLPQCSKIHVLVHGAAALQEPPFSVRDACSMAADDAVPHLAAHLDAAANHDKEEKEQAPAASFSAQHHPSKARFFPMPHLSSVLNPSTCRVGLQVEIIIACRKTTEPLHLHTGLAVPGLLPSVAPSLLHATIPTMHTAVVANLEQPSTVSPRQVPTSNQYAAVAHCTLQQHHRTHSQKQQDADQQDVVSHLSAATAALSMQQHHRTHSQNQQDADQQDVASHLSTATPSLSSAGKPNVSPKATLQPPAHWQAEAAGSAPSSAHDKLAWTPHTMTKYALLGVTGPDGICFFDEVGQAAPTPTKMTTCCLGVIPATLPSPEYQAAANDDDDDDAVADAGSPSHMDLLWWQCGLSIKGLPMPKQNQ